MKYLAMAIGILMSAIYSIVNNYGITVIILTIIVRAILIPLYAKQQKYTQKMSELQPKIKEIQTLIVQITDENGKEIKVNAGKSWVCIANTATCKPVFESSEPTTTTSNP